MRIKQTRQPAARAVGIVGMLGRGLGPVFVEGVDDVQMRGGVVGFGQGSLVI